MPQASFIPPRAEDVVRAPRMPRADELPIPGQRILEQNGRGQQAAAPAQPEKKRVTLMERLAAAGFGRKHDDDQAPAPQPRAPAPNRSKPRRQRPGRKPIAPRARLPLRRRASRKPRR